ncbi:MAG: hypothetical protein O7G86_19310, partial [Gammaproteobacteria bacterium]|nr:hypothetical protein [Gammaproteobacteria bacterium]
AYEITHIALVGIVDFPVPHDHPDFPDQQIPWDDILQNTPVTKEDIQRNVETAAKSLAGITEADLPFSRLSTHIDNNPNDTVSGFGTLLMGRLTVGD